MSIPYTAKYNQTLNLKGTEMSSISYTAKYSQEVHLEGVGKRVAPPPNSIFGYVYDAISKKPIPNATVTLVGVKQTSTASDGYYEFRELKAGNYTIHVYKEGYLEAIKNVELKEGESKRVDFYLTSLMLIIIFIIVIALIALILLMVIR